MTRLFAIVAAASMVLAPSAPAPAQQPAPPASAAQPGFDAVAIQATTLVTVPCP